MRLKILSSIITAAFALLVISLFYVQIVRGGYYYRLSQENRIRLVVLPSARGKIFDSGGALLVDNILSYDLVVIPQELKDRRLRAQLFNKLSPALGISVERLEAAYKKNYIAPFADVPLAKNIDKKTAFELEQMNLDLPAAAIRTKLRRHYLHSESTAHLLGYIGEINRQQLLKLSPYGYQWQDFIGHDGIEKFLDSYLKGSDGGMQVEVDNRGYQVRVLGWRQPQPGRDVRLTINTELQDYIYSLLEGRKGSVIVMDPLDGRILALVSSPSFDPNLFYSSSNDAYLDSIFKNRDAPLLNRAVGACVPPGSIFKIVTATAGLETGVITENTRFECPGFYEVGGKRFGCWFEGGHGSLDLKEGFLHSCNVFFFKVGRKLGRQPLQDYAAMFNLGRQTGIDLPQEARGLLPDSKWKRKNIKEPWYDGDTVNLAIGQGYILITPLQAATMISIIANGGKFVQPYIAEYIDGLKVAGPKVRNLPISAKTIDAIRQGLRMAVGHSEGTGRLACVNGLSVSGKTGTAQIAGRQPHAWFIGFAPSENPKAAVSIFLENGGYGGEQAAPICGQIFQKMKELGLV